MKNVKMHRECSFFAFTLAEMMVVLLIMTILLAVMAPVMTQRIRANNGDTTLNSDSPWSWVNPDQRIEAYLNSAKLAETRAIIGQGDASDIGAARLILNASSERPNHIQFKNGTDQLGTLSMTPERSIQFGNATATGKSSVAIGNASSKGDSSVSIGNASSSEGKLSITIGNGARANMNSAINIASYYLPGDLGDYGAIGLSSVAIGSNSGASGAQSIAIGPNARASGKHGISIGYSAGAVYPTASTGTPNKPSHVTGPGNIAIGMDTCASINGSNNVCLGDFSGTQKTFTAGEGALHPTLSSSVDSNGSYQIILGASGNLNGGSYKVIIPGAGGLVVDKDLTVNGNIIGTVTPPSDIRLKNIGTESKAGLEKIKQLKVFNYTFKKDEKKVPRVGVMAQDLQKVFPDAVSKGSDGFLAIRMEDMFYAVVNAVKELDAKIEKALNQINEIVRSAQKDREVLKQLQKDNSQLKKENAELKARLDRIEAKLK